ncbi:hypothetical protein ACVWXO_003545 [Bradyrhizobium sp. LM2.7]
MSYLTHRSKQAKLISCLQFDALDHQRRTERGWSSPSRQQFEVMCGPNGAFLIGDPETVVSKMLDAGRALGGVSRITFQMSTASIETVAMKRSIELGTEVGATRPRTVKAATAD